MILDYDLPREVIPTQYLNDPDVWDALLHAGKYGMPLGAMIRNLGNMTKIGLVANRSDAAKFVVSKLENAEAIKYARIHPVDVVKALFTYRNGQGLRGSSTWYPVNSVVEAVEGAFYTSFGNVEPTGKRLQLNLDVSGSMVGGMVGGVVGFNPRVASAVMAMVTARAEGDYEIYAFSGGHSYSGYGYRGSGPFMMPLSILPSDKLEAVTRKISNLPFDSTDCSLPMRYAQHHDKKVDAFIVYTDSETGGYNPSDSLRQYRRTSGISDAKLIVVGMVANQFSIADPNDPNMLDVVGFDTSAPQAMSMFVRGEV